MEDCTFHPVLNSDLPFRTDHRRMNESLNNWAQDVAHDMARGYSLTGESEDLMNAEEYRQSEFIRY